MPRSKASWIRAFAQQGMSREEIMGLLGVSRYVMTNALGRPLCDGELPVQPVDACAKCGAASFEQEPSCVGMARRCGACGAHYRYWTERRKPRAYAPHNGKVKPIPPQGRPRKTHCAGCGASPGRAMPKFSGQEVWEARHCWVCGASKSEWRMSDIDRTGSPHPPAPAPSPPAEAELERVVEVARVEPGQSAKLKPMVPVRPRICAREGCGAELWGPKTNAKFCSLVCGSYMRRSGYLRERERQQDVCVAAATSQSPAKTEKPKQEFAPHKSAYLEARKAVNEQRVAEASAPTVSKPSTPPKAPSRTGVYTPEELAARKRAVEERLAELRAEEAQKQLTPKRGHKTQDVINRHRESMTLPLRDAFETSAWKHMTKRATVREEQDAADEWLRKHDRELKREHPVEDEPMPEAGTISWSKGGHVNQPPPDATDWRGELRAAAKAGDEYAQWRCWELFDAPDEDEKSDAQSVA